MRQVTHALLTRPPLSHKNRHSEEIQFKRFARLACVRHAASVHPEPGSNSRKKFSLGPEKTTRFSYPVTYCFWVGIFRCLSLNYSSQKNLQGRCLLFSYQSSWCFAVSQRVSLNIIPSITMSVKTIFYLFFTFFNMIFPVLQIVLSLTFSYKI